ncbi:TM2 domain-containing protein [Mycobacterium kubicae]|uniref:TM2 domain-containing protein n=1 Tax=Mycobacterium kubicae TaxID=120959 RepID=UPI0007FF931A|nr:TM2 domain-containing protein [Mycobacterium kubicae]OBK49312.1 hypothetical protein A5657_22225 [Mycobacterium kubicae]
MATPNPPGEEPWGSQPYGPGWQQHPPPYPGTWGYPHNGYPGNAFEPSAPFGRHPVTGQPLSDKSAVVAGCLQLFFGYLGIGRFYIGSTAIAAVQLALGLFGLFFTVFCFLGLPLLFGVLIWSFVDAIMMFIGNVADGDGRKLR